MTGPGTGIGGRPNIGGPSVSNPIAGRPGVGNPGVGNPGVGNRPGVGNPIAGRPGVGNPGVGNRPGTLPGLGLGAAAGIGAGAIGDGLGRRQGQVADRAQNLNNRSGNLQDRLGDRQDIRQDRLDNRTDRREDWQNFRDDYYGYHGGWYNGAWCDHWGDYWSHMWSDHTAAMVLGTTLWGVNRMNYWFGTEGYSNPYYVESTDPGYVYYSPETIPATTAAAAPADPTAQALPPGVTSEGLQQFDAARASFYAGQYQQALTQTDAALKSMPNDAVVHEFRALCLFALGNYKAAAATLNPVLAVGPGWDWTTMSSLYPSTDVYTNQLRSLEAAVTKTPSAADARFVLAYHYLACGHTDNAKTQFAKVLKQMPNDTVTAQLVKMLAGPDAKAAAPPPQESTVKIDATKLQGTWNASRGGKTSFELTLSPDKSFRWLYKSGKTTQEVKGAYAIDKNVLAMEPDAGGVMLAEIADPSDGMFAFKPVGVTGSDLQFRKQ
jgi:tetratricopeptide (TPR) repeat protein